MLNVVIGYPTAADERTILAQTTSGAEPTVTAVATGEQIERARLLVREIVAAENVVDYAARLVRASRGPGGADGERGAGRSSRQWVRWGAGPRAGQSLLLAGKARAVLHGRPAVSLEDVRAVAPPVLRHRMLVNFQAEADGIDAETGGGATPRRVPYPAAITMSRPARRHIVGAPIAARSRARDEGDGRRTSQGLHRSPFHGYSAEFSQYRHYRPGDDLKYVDWKVFAPDRSHLHTPVSRDHEPVGAVRRRRQPIDGFSGDRQDEV